MSNADTELLTEHFGYPPVSLLDDIINSVNILAERALNSVEQALLRQPAASLGFKPAKTAKGAAAADPEEAAAAAEDAQRLEVENGTHQLETLLCASIDRNFDKFELYVMRNILCVRPEDRDWIQLAHYEGLDFDGVGASGTSGEPGEPGQAGESGESGDGGADKETADPNSDAAIAHLHRRLQASLKLGNLLAAETAQNEALLAQLRRAAGKATETDGVKAETEADAATASSSLAFLLDRGPLTGSDKKEPLTTTTAFALSQLPALRQLSGALRDMAPGLAAATAEDEAQESSIEGADKTWRRERLEYIESSTKKYLERNGRSTTGENGSNNPDGGSHNAAVEPAALTNILSILRENHGSASAAAKASEQQQPDADAMDES